MPISARSVTLNTGPKPGRASKAHAIGSVAAGYVGLGNRFERFLEPSLARVSPAAPPSEARGTETALMAVSIGVAFAGIGLAAYFFLRNRRAADEMARRFAGLHRVLSNKYYVDEIYDATIVQPIRIVAEDGLWRGADVRVIDGLVNGTGRMVGGASELMRRFQTGSVRAYAASLFLGVVLILGYYLWR